MAGLLKSRFRDLNRLLRRGGATQEDAEDLVQEAILRLHIYTRTGAEVRNPEAFVTRTAFNLAVDAYRRARGDRYESNPIEELDLIDPGPTPDEVFAAEQRLLKMKEALDRVSSRTREIFLMHRLQGFSHMEIARKLGISQSAVEKHVASAVTALAMQRRQGG